MVDAHRMTAIAVRKDCPMDAPSIMDGHLLMSVTGHVIHTGQTRGQAILKNGDEFHTLDLRSQREKK